MGENPPDRRTLAEHLVRDAWESTGASEQDVVRLDAEGADPDRLRQACQPGLFGTPPALWIRRLEKATAGFLEALVENIPVALDAGIAVILEGNSASGNTKAGKALQALVRARGRVCECKPPRLHELAGWVAQRAREAHGRGMNRDAAQLLVERAGTSDWSAVSDVLGDLDAELAKLNHALPPGAALTEEVIADLVGDRRPAGVSTIVDALLVRSPLQAIAAWQSLRRDGVPVFLAAQTAFGEFSTGARLRSALDAGAKLQDAAERAGLPGWKLRLRDWGAVAQCRDTPRWRLDLGRLARLEVDSKSGRLPWDVQIDFALLEISR